MSRTKFKFKVGDLVMIRYHVPEYKRGHRGIYIVRDVTLTGSCYIGNLDGSDVVWLLPTIFMYHYELEKVSP